MTLPLFLIFVNSLCRILLLIFCERVLQSSKNRDISYFSDEKSQIFAFFAGQSAHWGFCALQISRPNITNLWHSADCCFFGTRGSRVRSTCRGSFFSHSPKRQEIRIQWVSATMPPLPKTSPRIRFAIFLPTPGSERRSCILFGTLPPNFSTMILLDSLMFLAFPLYNPQDFMRFWICSSSAFAIACGVGKALKSSFATIFTRSSVHCAESLAQTSNFHGEPLYSKEQFACG